MNCYECPLEAEYFCSCEEKYTILCKNHIYSHIGDLHKLKNLHFYPDDNEREELALILYRKIKDLESKKEEKIREAYQELEKIKDKLKNTINFIEADISSLQNLTKKIFTTVQFLGFDKICSLFKCPYEKAIEALESEKFINPQNYSTEIIHWSKLDKYGEFVPYSQADNREIEIAFQSGRDVAYIGEMSNQCYVVLGNQKLEAQEREKRVVTVLRNDGSGKFDHYKYLNYSTEEQWWFEIDDSKWERMTPEASRVIEWAFQNGFPEAIIQIRRSYKIDIKGMKQTNLQNYGQRNIKRGYSYI